MLIGDEFVFIHYPKTAGKSLTRYMIEAWRGPIQGFVSKGQFEELADLLRPGIKLEIGRGHENMRQAEKYLNGIGKSLEEMRAVFACIRNPYDIAVSTYTFLREHYRHNKGRRNFEAAISNEFDEFWQQTNYARPERWLTLNGEVLHNQRLLRFETLKEDLNDAARDFEFRRATLAHINKTSHNHYRSYVTTPECEAAIYRNFRYLFDGGVYEREHVAT